MDKIRLSPAAWILILLIIASLFLAYFHEGRFTTDSVFNKQSTQMIEIMWGLFLVYLYGDTLAKHKSPKAVNCQGSSTWIPMEPALLKVPRNKQGKQPCPDIRVVQRGSYMALGIFVWGGGKHGFDLYWDIPGMGMRLGDNLVINSQTRKCYVGREAHQRLGLIYDLLKADCDSKGLTCTDDTPIWCNFVPTQEIHVPTQYREALMDFLELNEMFGSKLGYKDTLLQEQFMNEEARRMREHGPNWRDSLRPKLDEQDRPEPRDDNQRQ